MRKSVYSRPAKPLHLEVKERRDVAPLPAAQVAAPVIVDKATECHVTPSDVAARMVEYLGPQGDYLTLEPSAGTGQLARALIASGHSTNELILIERHTKLAAGLYDLGAVLNMCFLEYAERYAGVAQFPRIIMNPPFREVRKHIAAAVSLLGRGGHIEPATLVALVPVTFEHSDAEELERLPDTTFSTVRVHTKIIRIQR